MAALTPTVRRISFASPSPRPSPYVPGSSARRTSARRKSSTRKSGAGQPQTLASSAEDNLRLAGLDVVSAFQTGNVSSAAAFATQMRSQLDARIADVREEGALRPTEELRSALFSLELERDTWLLAERSMRHEETLKVNDLTSRIADAETFGVDLREGLKRLQTVAAWLETLFSERLERAGGAKLKPLDDPAYKFRYSSPDAHPHIDYYNLDEIEMHVEERVTRELWRVIQAGRKDEAEALSQSIGQHWRSASVLAGGQGVAWLGANGSVGGARKSWRNVVAKIVQNDNIKMTPYEKAIMGVIAGLEGPALAVCESYDERLWVRASCAIQATINGIVKGRCQDYTNEQLLSTFLQTDGITDSSEEASSVRLVRSYIALGSSIEEDQVAALLEVMKDATSREECSTWLLRFYAHICLLLRICGTVDGADATLLDKFEAILSAYAQRLMHILQRGEEAVGGQVPGDQAVYEMIARYSSQLSEPGFIESCSNVIRQCLFADVTSLTEHGNRCSTCVSKLAICSERPLLRKIAQKAIDKIWAECLPGPTEVAAEVKEVMVSDERAILATMMLSHEAIDDAPEMLIRATKLARRYGTVQNIPALNRLLGLFPNEILTSLDAGSRIDERHELECWHLYMYALNRHNEWRHHFYSNRPVPPPQESQEAALAAPGAVAYEVQAAANVQMNAYLQQLEEYSRISSRLCDIAVEALRATLTVPGGWMRDLSTSTISEGNYVERRSEELRAVRAINVPLLVSVLHSTLHASDRHQEATKVVDLVADERTQLYKDFPPVDLRGFVLKTHESFTALAQQVASRHAPAEDLFPDEMFEDL
mmetsp:Transcript_3680/g.10992  ORF Transcript_3680/g.10992 Transcript_3680/m.10992 type:complete len:826 (+) Transcript_3680:101-2578(+)|eukprot:CAMPEP_0198732672 /NCGR_PEP_ID=MMETSP1475-20131203/37927_1 /TAXON_ID= ORGANISM="Unidentified sp., Strain CCMP1999" /NCGR_SAMPLE_ID=MMETSP1475 /ASSEMBLY_ACC=CAM_ASM_001111 /LENGTH=825 /DNA_ID=CAMNT_0044495815 /DNA_START=56 /DNA_END=2533 /DNA_ORIENTATION=-